MAISVEHPERFDPREGTGLLIDSEHRARYWWAARAAGGMDVLDAGCGVGYGMEILAAAGSRRVVGVDLDPDAVAAARDRFGELAVEIAVADLGELPHDDESFDLIVCLETIEHVEDPEQALAELRRVLRDDGLLILSTPNPDAYLAGNQHHVREFRPDELRELVGGHFANVAAYGQEACLGSAIERRNGDTDNGYGHGNGGGEAAAAGLKEVAERDVLRTTDGVEDPTYTLVVASDAPIRAMGSLLALGGGFDLRWWSGQLAELRGELRTAAEREEAQREQLDKTATALLDANQALAQIPVLRHRLETLESELHALEQHHDRLSEAHHELLDSSSWRITRPLRRLSALLGRRQR